MYIVLDSTYLSSHRQKRKDRQYQPQSFLVTTLNYKQNTTVLSSDVMRCLALLTNEIHRFSEDYAYWLSVDQIFLFLCSTGIPEAHLRWSHREIEYNSPTWHSLITRGGSSETSSSLRVPLDVFCQDPYLSLCVFSYFRFRGNFYEK